MSKKIIQTLDSIRKAENPTEVTTKDQIIHEDKHYTCFIPTQAQVKAWADNMKNAMWMSYNPLYVKNQGIFFFICEKGNFDNPLNASYLTSSKQQRALHLKKQAKARKEKKLENSTTFPEITKIIEKNLAEEKKIFANLTLDQCWSNGKNKLCPNVKIYMLKNSKGEQILTKEQRQQLYKFYKELMAKTGFDGAQWIKDFDKVMKKAQSKQNEEKPLLPEKSM